MKVQFSTLFYRLYKKTNVRIKKEVDRKIKIFRQDPLHPSLHNHELRDEYQGLRSIDVTTDYRAIYEEIKVDDETIAYFSLLGTHKQLYEMKIFTIELKN